MHRLKHGLLEAEALSSNKVRETRSCLHAGKARSKSVRRG